eukprot:XP_001701340.1 predicted protein [Chlamydomonas reinhardtii]
MYSLINSPAPTVVVPVASSPASEPSPGNAPDLGQDFSSCYSPATVSAMARLLGCGANGDCEALEAFALGGWAGVGWAGASTPLDEASAALALLTEAGAFRDERCELMAPLRGLLSAAEHLYDLAIAHLAQGVTTCWPQHVLQALTYFEKPPPAA